MRQTQNISKYDYLIYFAIFNVISPARFISIYEADNQL